MTAFVLPLTVRTAQERIDLLVELAAPVPIGRVLADLLACAGLPAGARLHLGAGPVEPSLVLGRAPLLAGVVLGTVPAASVEVRGAVRLSCVAGPDAGGSVAVDAAPLVVGRDPGCALVVDDPEVSRRHAAFSRTDDQLAVTDLGSANGVQVDGEPVTVATDRPTGRDPTGSPGAAQPVPPTAVVRLGGSLFRTVLDAEPRLVLTPDDAGHLAVSRPARVDPPFRCDLGPPVPDPPTRTRRPLPLLATAMSAAVGVAVALLTGMWTFLLLAALGPVLMMTSALSDRYHGRRSHRRDVRDHRERAADRDAAVRRAVEADRLDAWDRFPDPATLVRRATDTTARLWARRPDDPEFLLLTCGVGSRPGRLPMPDPPVVTEVPIVLDLAEIRVLGIAGAYRPLLRHLLAQLVCLHSPADVHLVVLSEQPDLARLRDLPHCGPAASGQPGSVATRGGDGRAGTVPAGGAGSVPAGGAGAAGAIAAGAVGSRHRSTVLVLEHPHHWRQVPGVEALLARAALPTGPTAPSGGRAQVVVICAARREQELPLECTAIASVERGLVRLAASSAVRVAEVTGVSAGHLDRVVEALSGLSDPRTPGGGLPASLRRSDVSPGDAAGAMRRSWFDPHLTAVLGVGAAGPVVVDLERDGPHTLVAGTTGSGKSELLRTLVAGLAASAPPSRAAFVLIDYKGGAAFGKLAQLPHTTGLVTDLDAAAGARALTGLRAELRRRERLLADAGVADLTDLRALGTSPPSLVIVVDEFATLAGDLPEFLAGLLDVAQRGRSLGLHLVLATQRPAGVLSPAMRANINLRICLRVLDDADSIDVIETADAARLDPSVPGRAYLRAGRGSAQLLQVATVSAATPPPWTVHRRDPPGRPGGLSRHRSAAQQARASGADQLGRTGGTGGGARDGTGGVTSGGTVGGTDLDEIVAAAVAAARGHPAPVAAWLPPLPTDYRPAEPDVVGLLDRPDQQTQVALSAPAGSVLVLGPPGSGRSCGLRQFAWTAAGAGSELLVVDVGGSLADLAGWASTSTYLSRADATLVQRLVRRVQEAAQPPPSGRHGAGPRGSSVLLIDGWDALTRELDVLDHGATSAAVAELAGTGSATGVRVVVSGDLKWQHSRLTDAFPTVLRLAVDRRRDPVTAPPGRGLLDGVEIQLAHRPAGSLPPVGPAGDQDDVDPAAVDPAAVDPAAVGPVAVDRVGALSRTSAGRTVSALPPTSAGRPASALRPASGGRPRIVVRALPDQVRFADLPMSSSAAVPLGLGGDDCSPVTLDLTGATRGLLVAGPRRSGVSTTLATLAVGAVAGGVPVLRAGVHVGPTMPGVDDFPIGAGVAGLVSALAAAQGPLLLVADEVDRWPEDGAALLERFLTVAAPGQYLALGIRLDRALRCHRGPVAELAALRTGVLLQADTADGLLLDVGLERRRGRVPAGRGHLVMDGRAVPLQVAHTGPVHADSR